VSILRGALWAVLFAACAPQRGTIGAMLVQDARGHVFVREVPADLAAAKAGVTPGDEVLLIDGRDVRALSSEAVHQALSGNVGEPVKLTLVRQGQIVRLTVTRAAPPPKSQQNPAP
jgi:C-terminal processing protease CtpA/Prc